MKGNISNFNNKSDGCIFVELLSLLPESKRLIIKLEAVCDLYQGAL